ncbi:MAG: cob(I)yrinic acid a,c-diamide adenosyltransferase [Planctomycetota bacterium]
MSITTGTGDSGESGLVGGQRVAKDDPRLEVYGTVDELNACLGVAAAASLPASLTEELEAISTWLFELGSDLATPGCGIEEGKAPRLGAASIQKLETWIEREEGTLPRLKHFILPGGCPAAAALHHARTVCRRSERHVVGLYRRTGEAHTGLVFLNRLSDLLFLYARRTNDEAGVSDIEWKPE